MATWIRPAKKPTTVSSNKAVARAAPPAITSTAKAASTAAAGAQGAEISRRVPPIAGAIRPKVAAPRIPASAPCAAWLASKVE
jgi:hypothetical protein